MDCNTTPRICKACGYPYRVDDSGDTHMDPPDDYRRGYQRYCLACWLGVGPKEPNLFGDTARPVPRKNSKASKTSVTKDRILQQELRQAEFGNPSVENESRACVYLWLCCEGWMRFGPFEWLRFDDERQAIFGPNEAEIAKKVDGFWRVPGPRGSGVPFYDPMITTTRLHPHRNLG